MAAPVVNPVVVEPASAEPRRRRMSDLCTRPLPERSRSASVGFVGEPRRSSVARRRASDSYHGIGIPLPSATSATVATPASKDAAGGGSVNIVSDGDNDDDDPQSLPLRLQLHWLAAGDQPLREMNINAARLLGCLVADGYGLCHILCEADDLLTDDVCGALLTLLSASQHAHTFLRQLIGHELDSEHMAQMVFRRNTAATRLVSYYFRIVGHDFLTAVLSPSIQDACNSAPLQDVNLRTSDANGESNEEALLSLLEVCRNVCDMVVQNIVRFPTLLRSLIQGLFDEVEARFPDCGVVAIRTFVFLRLLCPALVNPHRYSLLDSEPGKVHAHTLVMMAKLMQALVNFTGESDSTIKLPPALDTKHVRAFISNYQRPMAEFVKQLTEPCTPNNDLDWFSCLAGRRPALWCCADCSLVNRAQPSARRQPEVEARSTCLDKSTAVLVQAVSRRPELVPQIDERSQSVTTVLRFSASELLLEASAASAGPTPTASPRRPGSARRLPSASSTHAPPSLGVSSTTSSGYALMPLATIGSRGSSRGSSRVSSRMSSRGSTPRGATATAAHAAAYGAGYSSAHPSLPSSRLASASVSAVVSRAGSVNPSASASPTRTEFDRRPSAGAASSIADAVPPSSFSVVGGVTHSAQCAFEALLLDNQSGVLRALLQVMDARHASAFVRPIVLLASARGCGLSLVRHAVNQALETALAQGPHGMADLLEWWCDAELTAAPTLHRCVVAMEAVGSYVKAHINSALRARLQHALTRMAHEVSSPGGVSPAISSAASSCPTSPGASGGPPGPSLGSAGGAPGTVPGGRHAAAQLTVTVAAVPTAPTSSRLHEVANEVGLQLLCHLMPFDEHTYATTFAPPLRRLFAEVVAAFEDCRPGSGPQGVAGVVARAILPALTTPLEYGIATPASPTADESLSITATHRLLCAAAQRHLLHALDSDSGRDAGDTGAAADVPAGRVGSVNPTDGSAAPSLGAWYAMAQAAPAPDGPCVAVWEHERVTSRRGWARLRPAALDSIRQAVLVHFSQLVPHLEGEVETEVFRHRSADRFHTVMPLLEEEYATMYSPEARSPKSPCVASVTEVDLWPPQQAEPPPSTASAPTSHVPTAHCSPMVQRHRSNTHSSFSSSTRSPMSDHDGRLHSSLTPPKAGLRP